MAAQPRIDSDSTGGVDDDGVDVLVFSVLHDLLGAAVFLATHPLHAAYAFFFSRYLLSLASFFCPLLVSTSLLLTVLVTTAPYVTPGWPGVWSLGSTCGIAVAALCAELRPDGGRVSLAGQLCSFVLGPADVASVLRVSEIMGELCDIGGGSCLLLEEKGFLSAATQELPLQSPIGEEIFLGHWKDSYEEIFKDEIQEKNVISEDLKAADSSSTSSEHSCPSETLFVQETEEREKSIEVQSPSLPVTTDGGVSDGIEEKRVECDPVPVETKKCERVKSHSSISRRIRQWENVTSGNLKRVPDEKNLTVDNNSVEKGSLEGVKVIVQLETEESCIKKFRDLAQVIASVGVSDREQPEHEFVDVKELLQPKIENCSEELQAEESASIEQTEEELQEQSVQPEPELQEHNHKDATPEKDCQEQPHQEFVDLKELLQSKTEKCSKDPQAEDIPSIEQTEEELQEQNVHSESELPVQNHKEAQPEQECQDVKPPEELREQEYKDADEESETLSDDARKSTSIARRVHTRITSENLVCERSPAKEKEKEWKRTLACKLYEERIQLKLCRDRAVVGAGSSDDMDMLWEAYETGGGSSAAAGDTKRGGSKAKRGNAQEESVDEDGESEAEEEDVDDEGPVRQLCCLQALKFSTRKMNFGGGKPSLAKISKVLKRMTALSRVGSRRNLKG